MDIRTGPVPQIKVLAGMYVTWADPHHKCYRKVWMMKLTVERLMTIGQSESYFLRILPFTSALWILSACERILLNMSPSQRRTKLRIKCHVTWRQLRKPFQPNFNLSIRCRDFGVYIRFEHNGLCESRVPSPRRGMPQPLGGLYLVPIAGGE